MGKGDKKTKRGKLFQGSYGITRPRKKKSIIISPAAVVKQAAEELPVPELKKPKTAPAKKEPKAKKEETT